MRRSYSCRVIIHLAPCGIMIPHKRGPLSGLLAPCASLWLKSPLSLPVAALCGAERQSAGIPTKRIHSRSLQCLAGPFVYFRREASCGGVAGLLRDPGQRNRHGGRAWRGWRCYGHACAPRAFHSAISSGVTSSRTGPSVMRRTAKPEVAMISAAASGETRSSLR